MKLSLRAGRKNLRSLECNFSGKTVTITKINKIGNCCPKKPHKMETQHPTRTTSILKKSCIPTLLFDKIMQLSHFPCRPCVDNLKNFEKHTIPSGFRIFSPDGQTEIFIFMHQIFRRCRGKLASIYISRIP